MAVARVTLSKAAELRRRHHYYYATITTIVVVGASGKKRREKAAKMGERSWPEFSQHLYCYSHDLQTLLLLTSLLAYGFTATIGWQNAQRSGVDPSRSSHEINDGGEERVCQTDLTLAWMIYWSAIWKWDFSLMFLRLLWENVVNYLSAVWFVTQNTIEVQYCIWCWRWRTQHRHCLRISRFQI